MPKPINIYDTRSLQLEIKARLDKRISIPQYALDAWNELSVDDGEEFESVSVCEEKT